MRLPISLVLLTVPLLSVGPTSLRHIERETESATWTLGMDPTGDIEELPGDGVGFFRVSIAPQRAMLTWRTGDDVFIYEVGGADPVATATILMDALERDGLCSFVASQQKVRRDGVDVRRVWALQFYASRRQTPTR